MNTSSLIKMEYPFPPNSRAVIASLWRKDFEDADTAQAQDDSMGEIEKLTNEQRDITIGALNAYVEDMEWEHHPFTTEELVDSWRAMRHLCDLIRIGSIYLGVNGELYGLHEKVRILAEEG